VYVEDHIQNYDPGRTSCAPFYPSHHFQYIITNHN